MAKAKEHTYLKSSSTTVGPGDPSGEFFSPGGTFYGHSLPFSGFDGDFEIHIYVAFALQAWH
jgi:hypothetical protein